MQLSGMFIELWWLDFVVTHSFHLLGVRTSLLFLWTFLLYLQDYFSRHSYFWDTFCDFNYLGLSAETHWIAISRTSIRQATTKSIMIMGIFAFETLKAVRTSLASVTARAQSLKEVQAFLNLMCLGLESPAQLPSLLQHLLQAVSLLSASCFHYIHAEMLSGTSVLSHVGRQAEWISYTRKYPVNVKTPGRRIWGICRQVSGLNKPTNMPYFIYQKAIETL